MSQKITECFQETFGMHQGSVQWKLYKQIMFHQSVRLNENICYRCGKRIDNMDECSVEHKEPWLGSKNPIKLYFDSENLTWSHRKCNKAHLKKEDTFKNLDNYNEL
jgi:hypothetical protein